MARSIVPQIKFFCVPFFAIKKRNGNRHFENKNSHSHTRVLCEWLNLCNFNLILLVKAIYGLFFLHNFILNLCNCVKFFLICFLIIKKIKNNIIIKNAIFVDFKFIISIIPSFPYFISDINKKIVLILVTISS